MLRSAQLSPYEARGQVFVVAEAASLSAEASDALLKAIEEPGVKSPRNFFLLAPSRLDLQPTLRSRSLSLFLGAAAAMPRPALEAVATGFRASVERFAAGGGALWLLDAATRLDPLGKRTKAELEALREAPSGRRPGGGRIRRPARPAPLAVRCRGGPAGRGRIRRRRPPPEPALRRRMLALAEELLTSSPLRLRGIPADRILEGLVSRHFAG